jgi:hypothetical protein
MKGVGNNTNRGVGGMDSFQMQLLYSKVPYVTMTVAGLQSAATAVNV